MIPENPAVSTKELIKAEIDKVEGEDLDELYGLVKRFTNGGAARGKDGQVTVYVGSPRLVHREQAVDFEKEVHEDG